MAESKQKPRMSFINIIPSSVVTQALASAGANAVVIDQEHAPGAVDHQAAHAKRHAAREAPIGVEQPAHGGLDGSAQRVELHA